MYIATTGSKSCIELKAFFRLVSHKNLIKEKSNLYDILL
jgi:hypothetical protein